MATILMINVPYAGYTNPTLPIAEALMNADGRNAVYQ